MIALTNLTVIDGSDRPPQSRVTIVIEDERIAARGPSRELSVPAAASAIDCQGKYLIPGLWDMHTHIVFSGESCLATLVGYGVTSVRDMGGDLERIDEWREQIERGRIAGPSIEGRNVRVE